MRNLPLSKYLIGFLLLSVIAVTGVLFAGIKDMFAFNSATQHEEISLSDVFFYTRQNMRREAVRLSAERLPENSKLPSFHLYSSDKSLAALNENLPESGKARYIQGHLKVDSPELNSKVDFRYRGGIPLHWLNTKKSLRIKLPDFTNYLGLQRFNLVNPSTMETIVDWVSFEISREIGLLTPDYFPARVFFNNEYNGLHFFLGQADESLLRKTQRMPGNIYAGDNYALENPFGANLGINTRVFIDGQSQSLMWTDYRLWEKGADRNAESRADRRDIKKFISIINLEDASEFMREFKIYFDTDKYFKFWGLDTIVGSYHHDLYHNQKMYFDPYKGRFEPIQWDLRYWSSLADLPITPLLRQIKLNPILSHQLDRYTYSLLDEYRIEKIYKRIAAADLVIRNELAADPHRQQPSNLNRLEHIQTVVPFFMDEYNNAIEGLKKIYEAQYVRTYTRLNSAVAEYTAR